MCVRVHARRIRGARHPGIGKAIFSRAPRASRSMPEKPFWRGPAAKAAAAGARSARADLRATGPQRRERNSARGLGAHGRAPQSQTVRCPDEAAAALRGAPCSAATHTPLHTASVSDRPCAPPAPPPPPPPAGRARTRAGRRALSLLGQARTGSGRRSRLLRTWTSLIASSTAPATSAQARTPSPPRWHRAVAAAAARRGGD